MQSALTSRISSLDNSVLPRLQINLRKILDGTEELEKYWNAELNKVIGILEKLWDKYVVSAKDLLAERERTTGVLNDFLKKLGYV